MLGLDLAKANVYGWRKIIQRNNGFLKALAMADQQFWMGVDIIIMHNIFAVSWLHHIRHRVKANPP